MASIQRRTWVDKDGQQRTSYRVQIRRKGFPPVTATFDRKTDAGKWATETEADMSRRLYFPQHEAEQRTLAQLIERQLETVKAENPDDYERQRVMLEWWKAKLGGFTLSVITPELVTRHRDLLQREEGF